MLRSGKRIAAALTLLGDCAKGWGAIYIVREFAAPSLADAAIATAGIAVVLGHMFPIFFRFAGGKGVATTAGVLLGFDLALGGSALAVWVIIFALSRTSSLSALISAGLAPFVAWGIFGFTIYPVAVLTLTLLIFWRHKENIRNLISGKESQLKKSDKIGS